MTFSSSMPTSGVATGAAAAFCGAVFGALVVPPLPGAPGEVPPVLPPPPLGGVPPRQTGGQGSWAPAGVVMTRAPRTAATRVRERIGRGMLAQGTPGTGSGCGPRGNGHLPARLVSPAAPTSPTLPA